MRRLAERAGRDLRVETVVEASTSLDNCITPAHLTHLGGHPADHLLSAHILP